MKLFLVLAIVALVGCAVEGRAIRDVKSDLIAKGNDLVKKADDAIKTLEAGTSPNKAHEVTIVKTEEARIQKLIKDLEAATDDAKVKVLEHELTIAENRLTHELARVNHTPVPVPANPVTRDLKSDLIAKGTALLVEADAAVVKLEAAHNVHEAALIKTEEAHIKKLIADLTEAVDAQKVHALELELTHAETRLRAEVARANHTPVIGPVIHLPVEPIVIKTPVARDLKSDLITKGTTLVKQAEEAITKLSADTRHAHEVTVIKAEEARIQKLITDLTAATETTQITHLERELGALEARLAHELNRINHTGPAPVVPTNPVTRALKDTLTTRGNALVKQAEEAITKLEAEHKTHEASIVKAEEAQIKKLIADLAAATEETAIVQLERDLAHLESRLANELTRINHPIVRIPHVPEGPVVRIPEVPVVHVPVTRDLKSDLITKGTALVKQAEEAVTKLSADTRHAHEVTVIKAEEARIQKLVTDLTAATETAQITHLERELQALEARLAHELNRINHTGPNPVVPVPTNPVTRDLKSDLLTKGAALVKQAEEAVTKLTADKKTHEATVIKAEEARIQKAITDLTAATEAAQITHLEHELQALEARLAHELNRINHTGPVVAPPANPVTRDLKSDLITKGTALVKQAEEAITKLSADTRHAHEVTVIKAEEARIQKLVTDLTAATETTQITHLERELGALEARLAHELNRINHTGPAPVVPANPANPIATRDAKSDLIAKAQALVTKADEAIKTLEAAHKTHEVTVVKTEEAHIQKLITDLTAATDEAKIRTLEHELIQADFRLQHELARVNHTPTGPVVPANPTNP